MNRKAFFTLCFFTYVCTYLCRVDLSSALIKMEKELALSPEKLGMIGSLFFCSYACGQLINGFLGDRINPEKFVAIALAGTISVNFLISLSNQYFVILFLWCINGCFQSMFWGPIMRMLSLRFPIEKKSMLSTGMSCSMMVAYILTWSVLGRLLLPSSWRSYFLVPAILTLIVLFFWLYQLFLKKESVSPPPTPPVVQVLSKFISGKLYRVAFICVCLGLIKESVLLWAPVILTSLLGLQVKDSFLFLLIFPLVNFMGIFFSGAIARHFSKNLKYPLFLLFGIITCSAACLAFQGIPSPLYICLLAIISASSYGCNNILLGIAPLSYAKEGMVSSLVGIFDFSSYCGAAISSYVLGVFLTEENFTPVLFIWAGVSIIALLLVARIQLSAHHDQKEVVHAVKRN